MPLLARNFRPQFEAGVWPDLGNDAAPLIVDARNVTFDAGQVTPVPGTKQVFDTGIRKPILALASQFAFGLDRGFVAFNDSIREFGEGGFVSRGNFANVTQFAPFGNFTLAANGGKLLAKRAQNAEFLIVSAAPDTDFVVSASPYVLVLDKSDRELMWCHRDDIDNWQFADPASDAGTFPIRDMDGEPICMLPYLNGCIIFTGNAAWLASYIGPPNIFGVQKLGIKVGAVGRESVTLAKGRFYGMNEQSIWVSDGNTHEPLDTPILHERFFKEWLDRKRISEVVAWYDTANDRVVFFYPTPDGGRDGLAWNLRSNNWAPLTTGYRAADRFDAWAIQLLADDQGVVYGQTAEILPPNIAINSGLVSRRRSKIKYGYDVPGYDSVRYDEVWQFEPLAGVKSSATITAKFIPAGGGSEQDINTLREALSDEAWIETRDMDLGSDLMKFIDGVVVKIDGPSEYRTFFIYYAVKDRMNEPIIWRGPFSLRGEDQFLEIHQTARYLRLKLVNTLVQTRWKLTGFDYYGRVMGGRDI